MLIYPHLHILVNRINYDGKVLSDSNDVVRCEKILRDLEKKYSLVEVISSKQAEERAMTKDELEMMEAHQHAFTQGDFCKHSSKTSPQKKD